MFQAESIVDVLQCRSVEATHAIARNRKSDPVMLLNLVFGVGSVLETDVDGKTLLVEILYGKPDHLFLGMFFQQVL